MFSSYLFDEESEENRGSKSAKDKTTIFIVNPTFKSF